MALVPPAPGPPLPARGALSTAMILVAGTPDHSHGLDARLVMIARLAAERVAVAQYVSITALRGAVWTTVAVSDELIRAVDAAQYADDAGPCVDALRSGTPVGVPDIDATVRWPGFHKAARRMGLHASVSVPLYAGRGDAVAVLNVYSHDGAAMAPLIAAICVVHGHPGEQDTLEERQGGLDPGAAELVLGYAEALAVRATIRLALTVIMTVNRCSEDDAYLSLCIRAGDAGTDLAEAATALIGRGF